MCIFLIVNTYACKSIHFYCVVSMNILCQMYKIRCHGPASELAQWGSFILCKKIQISIRRIVTTSSGKYSSRTSRISPFFNRIVDRRRVDGWIKTGLTVLQKHLCPTAWIFSKRLGQTFKSILFKSCLVKCIRAQRSKWSYFIKTLYRSFFYCY